MRSQAQVEQLFRKLYRDLGKDPTDLVQIRPIDGGWDNAPSYVVTRKDMKTTKVWRRDLDDDNNENIKMSLSQFT